MSKESALGQFWTPENIASEMVQRLVQLLPKDARVLDPASGPGTFQKQFRRRKSKILELNCFDVDYEQVKLTRKVLNEFDIQGKTTHGSFIFQSPTANYDGVIMNPPYIRHEWVSKDHKERAHSEIEKNFSTRISRRANMSNLFILHSIPFLREGGILCAIVYDVMDATEYGKQTRKILDTSGEFLWSEKKKVPFKGVLVNAEVFLWKKGAPRKPKKSSSVSYSNGTFVALEKLLEIKRGSGLPKRAIYVSDDSKDKRLTSPFLTKQPPYEGLLARPNTRAFLKRTSKDVNFKILETLTERVRRETVLVEVQLVSAKKAPILFNYFIRLEPRHLWNEARVPASDNFYCVTPLEEDYHAAYWLTLNSDQFNSELFRNARDLGSGLHKLQVSDYKKVQMPNLMNLKATQRRRIEKIALKLIDEGAEKEKVREVSSQLVKEYFDAD